MKAQRLDKYLTTKYPNLSRIYIKNQIKLGNFLIFNKKVESRLQKLTTPPYLEAGRNPTPKTEDAKQSVNDKDQKPSGARVKPSYVLREGDFVAFAPEFALPAETRIQPNPEIKLKIIYENNDVIVIDKPAGLSVHPRQNKTGAPLAKEITSTLVSGLLAHYPPLASTGDNPTIRPGIVHRLDKDTSGIMIAAKNQRSFDWLKKQFKERKVFKKYIALVVGCPKESKGVIKTFLTRSKSDPSKQKVVRYVFPLPSDEGRVGWGAESKFNTSSPASAKASTGKQSPLYPVRYELSNGASLRRGGALREATTEYKIIKKFKDYCLIEAQPQTGRLHQIRAQFAWLGHPVAGDTKYGRKNAPVPPGLKRQFLHSAELEIILQNGEKKTFSSILPTELAQTIKELQKN